jgi:Na+/melibiose symporter-like transporter
MGESWRRLRAGLGEVVHSRPILVTAAAEALQYFSYGALETFLPLYATFVAGLSPFEVGTIFGAQLLATALSKPLMGRASDRVGRDDRIGSCLKRDSYGLHREHH